MVYMSANGSDSHHAKADCYSLHLERIVRAFTLLFPEATFVVSSVLINLQNLGDPLANVSLWAVHGTLPWRWRH